jgi:hypothetical protein
MFLSGAACLPLGSQTVMFICSLYCMPALGFVLGSGVELCPLVSPCSGALTFGTGVSLKMAVSRLHAWAADCGVREERLPVAGRSTDMSDYRLFPCLRATADLLMMPKQASFDCFIP